METAEERRLPVIDGPAAKRQQQAGVVVVVVETADETEVTRAILLAAEPGDGRFGADGPEFLAEPGIDRRSAQRVRARPARRAILERDRRIKSAELGAPAPRVRREWAPVEIHLRHVERIVVVVAVGIERRMRRERVGEAAAIVEKDAPDAQPIVIGVEAELAAAALKIGRQAVRCHAAQIDLESKSLPRIARWIGAHGARARQHHKRCNHEDPYRHAVHAVHSYLNKRPRTSTPSAFSIRTSVCARGGMSPRSQLRPQGRARAAGSLARP